MTLDGKGICSASGKGVKEMLQVLFCEVDATDEEKLKGILDQQLGKTHHVYHRFATLEAVKAFLQEEIMVRRLIFIKIHNDKVKEMEDFCHQWGGGNIIVGLGEDYQAGRLAFDLQLDYALQMPISGKITDYVHHLLDHVTHLSKTSWSCHSKSRPLTVVLDEVECFEMFLGKVTMFVGDQEIVVDEELDELEEALGTSGFFRVHNNYLVNVFALEEIINNTIFTKSGHVVLISPAVKEAFRQFCSSCGR